jgi:pimeloyl-ACP methyl ester carboxylesterase
MELQLPVPDPTFKPRVSVCRSRSSRIRAVRSSQRISIHADGTGSRSQTLRLDLKNIIVWMNDGGGPTAILALASQAERVTGLVVGGTFGWSLKPYRGVSRTLRLVTGSVFRAINRYANLLSRSMGSSMALGTRSLSLAERRAYAGPFKDRNARNRPLKLFRSFLDTTTQQELDRSLPAFHDKAVLIQFGQRDAMTGQKWPQRWAEEIPNHSTFLLPRVKHFTFEDAPEATVENFRAWWADLERKG